MGFFSSLFGGGSGASATSTYTPTPNTTPAISTPFRPTPVYTPTDFNAPPNLAVTDFNAAPTPSGVVQAPDPATTAYREAQSLPGVNYANQISTAPDAGITGMQVPTYSNYSSVIDAYNHLAATSEQHGNDALNWARNSVDHTGDLTNQVNSNLINTQNAFGFASGDALDRSRAGIDSATADIQRQRDLYRDPTRQASDMGASEAAVGQAFDAGRANNVRDLEGFGIKPSDARFGLDSGMLAARAAAAAGAGNTAYRQDEALGNQANAALLQQGNVGAGQAGQYAAVGNSAGNAAVGNSIAGLNAGSNALGTGLAWTGQGTSAFGGMTNAIGGANTGLNNQFQNQYSQQQLASMNEMQKAQLNSQNLQYGNTNNLGYAQLGSANNNAYNANMLAQNQALNQYNLANTQNYNTGMLSRDQLAAQNAQYANANTLNRDQSLNQLLSQNAQYSNQNALTQNQAYNNYMLQGTQYANQYALSRDQALNNYAMQNYQTSNTNAYNAAQTSLAADKLNQSSSTGLGSLLGAGVGILSNGTKIAAGAAALGLSEGGAIPDSASPSYGARVDDVPAVGPTGPARLNAGEFVLPKDVVEWKGQEFIQKLIQQARQQAQGAVAKPQIRPAIGAQ